MGKSRLHEAALDRARAEEMRVLRAAGAELERNVAFGVARQLLAVLLIGDEGLLQHELFELMTRAEPRRPTLVAIDDLHWCDPHSLEFVLYLLHRLSELPAALIMTSQPWRGEPRAEQLDQIAGHPRVQLVRVTRLGTDAVAELTRRELGLRADGEVVRACAKATAGNPFYLRELLLALREERDLPRDQLAERVVSLAPDAVTRSLRVRVGRLGADAGALARAVAILGQDVPLRHAAALAGLNIRGAASAADALAAVEVLLAREPLRFVHPLVHRAVEDDIPAIERASRHLDAARLLYAEAADAEQIAAHLLKGRPEGDAWVVQQLRAAAAAGSSRGAAQSAIGYLQRALDEPPPPDVRADVLAELGAAEAAAGMPAADEHLAAAAALITDPVRRAELALGRGRALYGQGLYEQAAHAYEDGLAELDEISADQTDELRDELRTGFIITAWLVPALQPRAARQSAELRERCEHQGPVGPHGRLLLAQAALRAAFAGEGADRVCTLAEGAWDEGRLLEHAAPDGGGWTIVLACFSLVGAYERSVSLADEVLDDRRLGAATMATATARTIRAFALLAQGSVSAAIADVERAREARRSGWRQLAGVAAANHCLCLIEAGELERAETALTEDAPLTEPRDIPDLRRLHALAELRLAQGRPAEALELALRTGALLERQIKVFGHCPWRTTAALAALALGEHPRALELARQAHALSEQTGATDARIRDLRVRGLCEGAERGLELLSLGAELGASAPPRLETLRLLVDFGAALRRGNHRAAAREPLQRAADAALAGGAAALHQRARTELAATGARPRREFLRGGPASLTPSERRIAELAVGGHSNREIAQQLFVTSKTVEYHLRNVYRKLGITGRREVERALRD
jgi:DNA-binding CsgD family transcriptional regulator